MSVYPKDDIIAWLKNNAFCIKYSANNLSYFMVSLFCLSSSLLTPNVIFVYVFCSFTPSLSVFFVFLMKDLVLLSPINKYVTFAHNF